VSAAFNTNGLANIVVSFITPGIALTPLRTIL
jgi:hypothetical protein